MKKEYKNKLYILIDKNLDPIYGAVQGGHAIAEWLQQHWQIKHSNDWNEDWPIWDWNNDYLIYLSVDIDKWKKLLWNFSPCDYKWIWFNEPDLNNKTTSIAIYPNEFPKEIQKKLDKEKLWGT